MSLNACGAANQENSSSQVGGSSSTDTSAWTYTDDTDHRIDLKSAPRRIAAFADQALVLLGYGVEPVAIFGRVDVASDPRFEDYDLSDI
ncbi:MAG TPA: hypothetical protein VJ976_00680, partial [Ornithinimicrobium sp.]|uniref:hypothetical protein n=1 Tax=Ornithinimicrobium sp. TaxID=1977084 RepID=UPI002B48C484